MVTYTIDQIKKRVERYNSNDDSTLYFNECVGDIVVDTENDRLLINNEVAFEFVPTIFDSTVQVAQVKIGTIKWNFNFRVTTKSQNYTILVSK